VPERPRFDGYPPRPALDLSEEAFAEVVGPHLEAMRATALRVLGCEHHACDAVQEALLSLWRQPRLPPNVRAWLLRTVTHRSLQLRRCCMRRRGRELRAAHGRSEGSCREDPAHVLGRRELRSLFAQACARLPEKLREVFVLREIDRLEYEVIADRTRVPIGTVRSRLNRSRVALRRILAGALSSDDGW
jgi:RNA polymerase sigma-70 factor (ECF subfamily)